MATYSKSRVALVVIAGLTPVVLIALFVINAFVYPFSSASPNFADVEAVYGRIRFPDEWTKEGEASNSGIAGRRCPLAESEGCFSKSASFSIPKEEYMVDIEEMTKSAGCISNTFKRNEQVDGPTTSNFECSSGALRVSGTIVERSNEWKAYVSVTSR